MTGVPWRPALLALGVVLNVALVFVALTWIRRPETGTAGTEHGNGAVECNECGTDNDPEYRFCRECVEELPGTSPLDRSAPSAASGLLR